MKSKKIERVYYIIFWVVAGLGVVGFALESIVIVRVFAIGCAVIGVYRAVLGVLDCVYYSSQKGNFERVSGIIMWVSSSLTFFFLAFFLALQSMVFLWLTFNMCLVNFTCHFGDLAMKSIGVLRVLSIILTVATSFCLIYIVAGYSAWVG